MVCPPYTLGATYSALDSVRIKSAPAALRVPSPKLTVLRDIGQSETVGHVELPDKLAVLNTRENRLPVCVKRPNDADVVRVNPLTGSTALNL